MSTKATGLASMHETKVSRSFRCTLIASKYPSIVVLIWWIILDLIRNGQGMCNREGATLMKECPNVWSHLSSSIFLLDRVQKTGRRANHCWLIELPRSRFSKIMCDVGCDKVTVPPSSTADHVLVSLCSSAMPGEYIHTYTHILVQFDSGV